MDDDIDHVDPARAPRQAVEASPARSSDSRLSSTSTARTGASGTTADSRITSLSQLGRVDEYLHARLGRPDHAEDGRPRLRGVEALLAFLDGEEQQEPREDATGREYGGTGGTHGSPQSELQPPWQPAEERRMRPEERQAVLEQAQKSEDSDGARTPPARGSQTTSRSFLTQHPSRSPPSPSASSTPDRRHLGLASKQRQSSPPVRSSGTAQSHASIPHESLHVHLQAAQDDVARLRRELNSVQSLMHELRAEQGATVDTALPRPAPRSSDHSVRVPVNGGSQAREDGSSDTGAPLGPVLATQAEVLDFVRRVDGLVWMTQEGKSRARPDTVVFENGKLDHVLRSVAAWEAAIRRRR